MNFAERITHPDVTRTVGNLELKIVRPYEINVTDFVSTPPRSAKLTLDARGDFHISESTAGPMVYTRPTAKRYAKDIQDYQDRQEAWDAELQPLRKVACEMVLEPAYVARQKQVEAWVHCDIEMKIKGLLKAMETFRHWTDSGRMEFGGSSTASAGNLEMVIAIHQAQLAAVVETYDETFRPYVRAKNYAIELLETASQEGVGARISLYVK